MEFSRRTFRRGRCGGRNAVRIRDSLDFPRNIKPRTRIHYYALLKDRIAPELGKLPIDTPQAVRSWYAKTLTDKPTMRAHAYGLLSSICNTAVKGELIERNPCMITGAMHAKTKGSISILEVGEIAALADAIKPERFKALILISAWYGLRYGEVTELCRKDIGEGVEVISIARRRGSPRRLPHQHPKSGKARTVVVRAAYPRRDQASSRYVCRGRR